jgi:hypothetical protein
VAHDVVDAHSPAGLETQVVSMIHRPELALDRGAFVGELERARASGARREKEDQRCRRAIGDGPRWSGSVSSSALAALYVARADGSAIAIQA